MTSTDSQRVAQPISSAGIRGRSRRPSDFWALPSQESQKLGLRGARRRARRALQPCWMFDARRGPGRRRHAGALDSWSGRNPREDLAQGEGLSLPGVVPPKCLERSIMGVAATYGPNRSGNERRGHSNSRRAGLRCCGSVVRGHTRGVACWWHAGAPALATFLVAVLARNLATKDRTWHSKAASGFHRDRHLRELAPCLVRLAGSISESSNKLRPFFRDWTVVGAMVEEALLGSFPVY